MWYLVLVFILLVLIFAVIGGLMEIQTREKYGEAAGTALFFGNFYGMLTVVVILVSLGVIHSKLAPKEPEASDVPRNTADLTLTQVRANRDTILRGTPPARQHLRR